MARANVSRTRTVLASCGGTFLVTFDGAAVQMVMPALRRHFHTSIYAVQWTMTAYLLATTVAYLPTGRLGDEHDRRRVWLAGLGIFVVGSLACAVVPSLWMLIAARTLQALGAAAITANSAPLLLEAHGADERARALSMGAIAIGLGLLVGPPAGALLTSARSWRLVFIVAVPLGVACALVARGGLPSNRRRRHSGDVWGALASAAGLGAVVVGASSGRQWGWADGATLALLGGGVALLAGFALLERARREPLLRLALFARRSFASGAASALLAYAALFTVTATMPFFLVDVQERSLVQAGLLVGVVPVSLALAAPAAGRVADRFGARWVCAAGLGVVAGGLIVAVVAPARGAIAFTIVALAAVGAGLGAYESPNSAASLGALGADELGIGSATLGVVRNLGMTLGAALAGTLLGKSGPGAVGHDGGPDELHAVHVALWVGAASAALGALVAALRPTRRLRR